MTKVFAAAEYSIGLIDTLVQDEFFSTRKVAEDAVQQRILKDAIRNIKWTWREREGKEGYWWREEDSFSFKLVVEERVVRDSLKDNSFIPLTPNDFTINTPLYAEPYVNKSSCLHDNCPTCNGTGQSKYGGICVHGLVCPCPKCSFR